MAECHVLGMALGVTGLHFARLLMSRKAQAVTPRRIVVTTLLAWLGMVGFDFLLHGGLMAGFYVHGDPFLLPPREAFRLIPLGYASFLLNAVLLVWLMARLGVCGVSRGAIFGVSLGGLVWGSWVLALASITTARYPLLAGWFIGQAFEMGLGGAVAGAALKRPRLRAVVVCVVLLVVGCMVATVVLQNTGLAPAQEASADG